jgi:hypothetical protein
VVVNRRHVHTFATGIMNVQDPLNNRFVQHQRQRLSNRSS